ncbi:hypothetical protein GUJ93_ZPchr0014g47403 [Zizania palustris]|uniref:Uncharacterized protein n=1 Tax=Zizania palustris TaxID=103762 RepID=A0A8J5TLE3_ZIZPA|nr:hypothetical protein GUJ93_ZPchr0014g47403 [Zizania palustris]
MGEFSLRLSTSTTAATVMNDRFQSRSSATTGRSKPSPPDAPPGRIEPPPGARHGAMAAAAAAALYPAFWVSVSSPLP